MLFIFKEARQETNVSISIPVIRVAHLAWLFAQQFDSTRPNSVCNKGDELFIVAQPKKATHDSVHVFYQLLIQQKSWTAGALN